jgi:hypothetical protein
MGSTCVPGLVIAALSVMAITLGVSPRSAAASEQASLSSLAAIRQVWPTQHLPTAIRIAKLESGLSPEARGCGGACYGLFQINYSANRDLMASIGIQSPSELLDPLVNCKAAYHLFRVTGGNWSPWGGAP